MKDLMARLAIQKNESSYGQRRTAGSYKNKKVIDEAAYRQWLTLRNGHFSKKSIVLCESWKDREVFCDWFTQHRDYDLTFCYHFSLQLPPLVGPETSAWVHEDVAVFMDWIYSVKVRRKNFTYYPIGVGYVEKRCKLESRWSYAGENMGDYGSRPTVFDAQIPFQKWLLEKINQTLALVANDILMRDLIALRGRLVHCMENRTVFEM